MIELRLFHERDVLIAAQLVGSVLFAVRLAIEPCSHHAAVLQVAEYGRAPIAKSLPCLQCQGHCLMHQSMTYTN